VKFKAWARIEDSLWRSRQAELGVAIRGSDSNQRIEKRVRAHDIPARPMFLNQHRFGEARVEMSFRTLALDARGFLQIPRMRRYLRRMVLRYCDRRRFRLIALPT
jgi:hypothetical protein